MCARRFLMVVFILTLLVVAGAFAIFQWGGQVLLRNADAEGHFEASAAGNGPDYPAPRTGSPGPGLPDNPHRWLPDGVPRRTRGDAAVFYIHPTTYLERDRWNAPLDAGGEPQLRARLFVQSQASAFNGVGDIWAPRYRQATFGAFLLTSDGRRSRRSTSPIATSPRRSTSSCARPATGRSSSPPTARARCTSSGCCGRRSRAGRSRSGSSRPMSSAGRSARTADLPALGLPACARRDQAGCILSWQSFAEPADPELVLDQSAKRGA